jgi:hypothetical protein
VFYLGPLKKLQQPKKAARIISGGLKLLGLPMQLKVLIHSPMQLKMVQQQHTGSCTRCGYSTKTSTKNTTRLSKVAEKLRQIRDDESLSIIQRTQANDLGGVLKQQLNAELAIARQALLVANLRIKAEGKSKEALENKLKH